MNYDELIMQSSKCSAAIDSCWTEIVSYKKRLRDYCEPDRELMIKQNLDDSYRQLSELLEEITGINNSILKQYPGESSDLREKRADQLKKIKLDDEMLDSIKSLSEALLEISVKYYKKVKVSKISKLMSIFGSESVSSGKIYHLNEYSSSTALNRQQLASTIKRLSVYTITDKRYEDGYLGDVMDVTDCTHIGGHSYYKLSDASDEPSNQIKSYIEYLRNILFECDLIKEEIKMQLLIQL